MKKLGLLLLVSLFIGCVYFSVNSTFAVAADEEPAPNWITEEPTLEPDPSEMDLPEDYGQYDEADDESDESDEEGDPEAE